MELHERTNFGQQVRDLCIGEMKYNVQLVSKLPMIFPGVRSLALRSGRDDFGGWIAEVNPYVFKAVAKNWKKVESIVGSSLVNKRYIAVTGTFDLWSFK